MGFLSKGKWRYVGEQLTESTAYLGNPSSGWYHIYPFALEKRTDFDELFWCLHRRESLVHVVIQIGAYRMQRIPDEAIGHLEQIFTFFKAHEKEMIVRITYDSKGQGLLAEPERIQTVLEHMKQLGPVVRQFGGQILAVQGLFVGSWGEMHDSRFLSKEKLRILAAAWREAIGDEIPIAVRTPLQWRLLHEPDTEPGTTRVGLFNDGMFGSQTDLGTYGMNPGEEAGWEESWNRADELVFLHEINRMLPYGGEVIGKTAEGALKSAVMEMKQTRTCYLNAVHDEKRLNLWKQEMWTDKGIWKGVNGYDYIGTHLGCRPVIRKVTGRIKQGLYLEINIENTGFSGLLEEAEAVVTEKAAGKEVRTRRFQVLPDRFEPETVLTLTCQFPEEKEDGEYQIFLQMRRKRDQRILRFANGPGMEQVCLGLFTNL